MREWTTFSGLTFLVGPMRPLSSFMLGLTLGACNGDPGVPSVIRVGGTYQTAVSVIASDCVGQTVEQHPTTVAHVPGATALTLTHAGNSYSGTLDADGSFRTAPVSQVFDGVSYQIGITGRFSTTAIDAEVHVAAARQPPCSFTARWVGPKDGAPNTLP